MSSLSSVIPAQAGIQWHAVRTCKFHWTPACAGVTEGGVSLLGLLSSVRFTRQIHPLGLHLAACVGRVDRITHRDDSPNRKPDALISDQPKVDQ